MSPDLIGTVFLVLWGLCVLYFVCVVLWPK